MSDLVNVLFIVIFVLVAALAATGISSIFGILQANKKVVEMAFQSLPPAVLTMLKQAFDDLHKLSTLLQDLIEPDEEDEDGDGTDAQPPSALG